MFNEEDAMFNGTQDAMFNGTQDPYTFQHRNRVSHDNQGSNGGQ